MFESRVGTLKLKSVATIAKRARGIEQKPREVTAQSPEEDESHAYRLDNVIPFKEAA